LIYASAAGSGTAGGVTFANEDILSFNPQTGAWAMYFDGSDVGLANVDVDAFAVQSNGSILFSFDAASFTIPGLGSLQDCDIVRFTPTSTGPNTAGSFSLYFDGSDVGLNTSGEDIDALHILPDGRIVISVIGTFSVTGASGVDEDLFAFTPTSLGSNTAGAWAIYFDGSDVGLGTTTSENVNGAWISPSNGDIYLSTTGAFSVTGLTGDGSDIFICRPSSIGATTACTFLPYWKGAQNGFSGQDTDDLTVIP
jgi:hypothetical protein